MPLSTELFNIAAKLKEAAAFDSTDLDKLTSAAEEIGKSASGSWLGYHSCVYYHQFQKIPPGAFFSKEWGMDNVIGMGTRGDWREYAFDDVINLIREEAGSPNTDILDSASHEAEEIFNEEKDNVISLLHANSSWKKDPFSEKLITEIESKSVLQRNDFFEYLRPSGKFVVRDMRAVEGGIKAPPHLSIIIAALATKAPFTACAELAKIVSKLASHLKNQESKINMEQRIGTNIFIGHGRSLYWRELKDFIETRLNLPWDEFNRIPVAGFTNIARLSQMLDQAAFAFLIMTAEDEQSDGKQHARMNVIHEVGLFQGRLGFEKAIVLLEEGCEEFTNIQGLGQIRFPKGKISAIFEEIRQVLERDNLI